MFKRSSLFKLRLNTDTFAPFNLCLLAAAFLLVLLTMGPNVSAQTPRPEPDPAAIMVERIFATADFIPSRFGGFTWLNDGNSFAKLEPSATIPGARDLVGYQLDTNRREVLIPAAKLIPPGEKEPLALDGYDWSADGRKVLLYTKAAKVWRQYTRGDYWVLDLSSGKLRKLGGAALPSTLMFAKFSPDASRVGYVRENDLYVENLADGKITRLTADGSHTLINGTSDWVNEEEFDLRDCWRWSPDGKSIAFWQFDASGIPDFLLVNNTAGLYPTLTRIPYPMAGGQNSAVRVGVIAAAGGKTTWLKIPGDPRNNYLVSVDWTNDSRAVMVQQLNRLQNTQQLFAADAQTGAARNILTEKDDAWIDLTVPALSWLDGGKRFLWISERDGWKHVYTVPRDGGEPRLITPGGFDVIAVQAIDQAGGWLYYLASPDNATQRFLYRTRLDGTGAAERVTPARGGGWNSYDISPNQRWAVQSSSSFGTYTKTSLLDLAHGAVVRTLSDNPAQQAKLDQLKKGPHEFFRIDIGANVTLDGWVMKPPDFDPAKKYPVVFYVYSGPSGQTVQDMWMGANYLWYLSLTQQGYLVASVDNRGTPAPRGRAWRKSIYGKLGVLNSADQAAAVRALVAKMPFIDAGRIAITGASSGGSATLDALFRYPDLYQVGMALAPGADNKYYDTIYTERYMGMPAENAEAYRQSAATTHIAGLKGDLLIIHGTGDDNVHYQSTEYLMDALIAANKPFTIMPYPGRSHSLSEGEGTFRHLYELMTRYLREHLPPGGRDSRLGAR